MIGIVTDRDVAIRAVPEQQPLSAVHARDVMTSNVQCCREHDDAEWAIREMEARQVRRMPVLNDSGALVGMLALGDIVCAHRPDLLEQVMKSVAVHRP